MLSTLFLFANQTEPKPDDLVPFYCASKAIVHGDNPYRAGPIAKCEAQVWAADWRATRWIAPAPLPPLALVLMSPISRVPFSWSERIWRIAILLAALLAAFLLSRTVRIAMPLLLAAFIPIGVIENGFNGQPVALALLLLVASAYALKQKKIYWAAGFAFLSLIEPHIGLPVCLALFIFARETRAWFAVLTVVAIAASIVLLPQALNMEYIFHVLPAHALAEANWYQQYSMTYALTLIGVPAATALVIGSLTYLGAVAVSMFAVARIRCATERPEFVVFIPAAFSVMGGSFIHVFQMIVALPAILLLWAVGDRFTKVRTALCLFLICIPWMKMWVSGMLIIPVLVASTIIYSNRDSWKIITASCMAAMAFTLLYFNVRPVATIPRHSVQYSADTPIDQPYRKYIELARPSDSVIRGATLAKVPTWTGLLLLAYCVFGTLLLRGRARSDYSSSQYVQKEVAALTPSRLGDEP